MENNLKTEMSKYELPKERKQANLYLDSLIDKILIKKDAVFYGLGNNLYAMEYDYPIVTYDLIDMYLPTRMILEMKEDNLQLKVLSETEFTRGKHRADAKMFKDLYPLEVAYLQSKLDKFSLSRYVIFKLEERRIENAVNRFWASS